MSSQDDLEKLEAKLSELAAWLHANRDRMGTPEFNKRTLVHRLLTDLVQVDGGTPEMRAAVMRRLTEIIEGTHPLLKQKR